MLHILTTDAIIARPDFVEVAESLLITIGSRGALHLRSRELSGQKYLGVARQLNSISRAANSTLVINTRVDVALAADTPAVQLGRDALAIADVRRIAPRLRVGVSIHSVEEAQSAAACSPDWIIAGHIFRTSSHPEVDGRGVDFLKAIVYVTDLPVIAVGGIKPEQLASLRRAGAAGVAVISGIWDENDPKEAAIRYLSEYDDRGSRGEHDPQR